MRVTTPMMETIITGWGSLSHPTWKWRLLQQPLFRQPSTCPLLNLTCPTSECVTVSEKMVTSILHLRLCLSSLMGHFVSWKLSKDHKRKVAFFLFFFFIIFRQYFKMMQYYFLCHVLWLFINHYIVNLVALLKWWCQLRLRNWRTF